MSLKKCLRGISSGKMMEEPRAYIIDKYNPNNKKQNEDAVQVFQLNGVYYAIFATELFWGEPILKNRPIDEENYNDYCIYSTLDEAKAFVHQLKELEGAKL